MPSALSYPGVYIEEVPSGVRTITGVATSIAAFVGRTRKGPVGEPVMVNSYADFERTFGGLWAESGLAYAVRDFYLNGGSQAVIVRLYSPQFADEAARTTAEGEATTAADAVIDAAQQAITDGATTPGPVAQAARGAVAGADGSAERVAGNLVAAAAEGAALRTGATTQNVIDAATAARPAAIGGGAPRDQATIDANGLALVAANPGSWANGLRARIDHAINPDLPEAGSLFNLSVRDAAGTVEQFRNVTFLPNRPRSIDTVLRNESKLVRAGPLPAALPGAHAAPAAGVDMWSDQAANTYDAVAGRAGEGKALTADDYFWAATNTRAGAEESKSGFYALERADLFNLLCLPPDDPGGTLPAAVIDVAIAYCEKRRAMLLIDPPAGWDEWTDARDGVASSVGAASKNAAIFFPRLVQPDPGRGNQERTFVPSGAVAGAFARTDSTRGVWKAPAGLDATLINVARLSVRLTDLENGQLNQLGINCLREMPGAGRVIWGARTRVGDDRLGSEWKYVPVRRTALFIEESLYRGTQWVVFEPNDEPLWASIRLNVGAFMQRLFRQGAFQGQSARDAYFVKCDGETTTQADINLGIVNILVGFAPLKPAEFVIIRLQQMAGNIPT